MLDEGDVPMRFGDPPPCDRCGEPSIVQIVIVTFEGASPPDQFLCRAHAAAIYVESSQGTDTDF
jgi:hypothetical protein